MSTRRFVLDLAGEAETGVERVLLAALALYDKRAEARREDARVASIQRAERARGVIDMGMAMVAPFLLRVTARHATPAARAPN